MFTGMILGFSFLKFIVYGFMAFYCMAAILGPIIMFFVGIHALIKDAKAEKELERKVKEQEKEWEEFKKSFGRKL